LHEALFACRAIQSFVTEQSFASYLSNLMLRSAVERQFEIVGEALSRAQIADGQVTDLVPDLRRIVGLRNRIIHGYDQIDHQIIWSIVSEDLIELIAQLENILQT